MGAINNWKRKCWVRSAAHYYTILFRQTISDANSHALRLASDMENEYGGRVKNWPDARGVVEEDVSYWER